MTERVTAIIGAGPAGLTAAYLLAKRGEKAVVFEADRDHVGGLARTVECRGFRFDIGGHRFFSKSAEVEDLWSELLPAEDLLVRKRSSRIYYRGRFFAYPLRGGEALRKLGLRESARCLLSYARARLFPVRDPKSFEDWVANQFGRRLFEIFFQTYTEKVWGMPCSEISAEWAAQRIKGLSLGSAIWSAFLPGSRTGVGAGTVKTLIGSFRYPRLGPGMLWERCAGRVREMGGEIRMGRRVRECRRDERTGEWTVVADASSGPGSAATEELRVHHVISTAPIRALAKMVRPELPASATAAAAQLSYRDFITVAVMAVDRGRFPDQWIYIHDPGVQVGRVQNFKAWSPDLVPDPGLTCYGMEYFCFARQEGLWALSDQELQELAVKELGKLGLAESADIVDCCVIRQEKAYPVYDENWRDHVATFRAAIEADYPNLHLIGRNGMHRYNNQDHSMMTAMLCVENIIAGKPLWDLWRVNEDAEYHESAAAGELSVSGLRQVPVRVESGSD